MTKTHKIKLKEMVLCKTQMLHTAALNGRRLVLPEIEQLLPPLSGEQFSSLESDSLENGCYAPIIINENMVIIGGHDRFRICEKRSLPYKILVFSFADLLEAKQWALYTQKGRRNLDKWELGQIVLRLRLEIEAKAKTNQGTRTDLSVNSSKGYTPTDTHKEMAQTVGVGEQAMGRIVYLTKNAPPPLRGAGKQRSVHQPRLEDFENCSAVAAEKLSAVREIDQLDAEAERRGKVAALFCKAYERAVLLTPTLENVRIWVENTRMKPDEVEDSVRESYELAQTFQTIGDLLKNEILRDCQQTAHSVGD